MNVPRVVTHNRPNQESKRRPHDRNSYTQPAALPNSAIANLKSQVSKVSKVTGYSSSLTEVASPLLELTCHMGSHSVTCHPAEVTFQPLPQPKLVLDLATPEGCKAELTQLAGYM